ncbi:MAG: hypothetical protein K6B52_04015, partial [Clostridiales bacterium]|nr:hypothetical protein [Clostridiales bacterium]
MKKDYRQSVNFGIRIISVFLAVLTVYVTGRFAYVVFAPNTGYRENASKSQWSSTELTALRGNIYDSEGNVLAKSAFVWKFYVIPKNFRYISDKSPNEPINEGFKKRFCDDISAVIGIESDELLKKCTLEYSDTETVTDENGNESPKLITPERVYIKSKIENDEKEKIESALHNEKGEKKTYIQEMNTEKGSWEKKFSYTQVCGFETDVKRYYPYSTFASNLIGMVEADDNSVGQTGIEAYYNTNLKGVNGRKTSYGSRTDD